MVDVSDVIIGEIVAEYIGSILKSLVKNATQSYIIGNIIGNGKLAPGADITGRVTVQFGILEKDALKFTEEYKKQLLKGGCEIDGEFIPWLQDKGKRIQEGLGEIIQSSIDPGKSYAQVKREIQDLMGTESSHALTIARTEMSRVKSEGERNRYSRAGVEEVKWLLGPKPCPICIDIAGRNGGIYKLNEVPYQPVHPRCVCDIAPVIDIGES